MKKVLWTILIILGLVALFFLPGLLMGRFGGFGWFDGHRSMMGGFDRGGFDSHMMGGFGFWSPLTFLFMALRLVAPLGLLVLAVMGAVALANNFRRPAAPAQGTVSQPVGAQAESVKAVDAAPVQSVTSRACAACGKPAQPDWNTCPYCGRPLDL